MCKDLEISNRLFIDDLEQYPRNTEGGRSQALSGLAWCASSWLVPSHRQCVFCLNSYLVMSLDVWGGGVPQSMEMKHHYSQLPLSSGVWLVLGQQAVTGEQLSGLDSQGWSSGTAVSHLGRQSHVHLQYLSPTALNMDILQCHNPGMWRYGTRTFHIFSITSRVVHLHIACLLCACVCVRVCAIHMYMHVPMGRHICTSMYVYMFLCVWCTCV